MCTNLQVSSTKCDPGFRGRHKTRLQLASCSDRTCRNCYINVVMQMLNGYINGVM